MDFQNIVQNRLEQLGFNAFSASKALNLKRDEIRDILRGRTPSIDKADRICKALGLEFHIGLPDEPKPKPEPSQKKIPVLGMAACGKDGWANLGANDMSAILPDRAMSDLSFAVIATGESLAPLGVLPGAVCYCDPKEPVTENQLVYIERLVKRKISMTIKRIVSIDRQAGDLRVYGYKPSIIVEDQLDEDFLQIQETFDEIVYKEEIVRIAPVCWINTNPVL